MKEILSFEMLLPIAVLFLQVFIIMYVSLLLLKKLDIVRQPFSGLEYSHAIFASIAILSVLVISTASTTALFQTFKTYQNQGGSFWQAYLSKSGQFFLIVLFFELLLGLVLLVFLKSFLSFGDGIKEIKEGSIPSALVTGSILLGFSIAIRVMAVAVMEYLTPQYLNFR